jgi:hypothetical protein
LKQQSSGPSVASVQSADKTTGVKAPDLIFSEEKHVTSLSEFPSNFVTPSIVDNTNAVQQVVSVRCYVFIATLVVSLLEI